MGYRSLVVGRRQTPNRASLRCDENSFYLPEMLRMRSYGTVSLRQSLVMTRVRFGVVGDGRRVVGLARSGG